VSPLLLGWVATGKRVRLTPDGVAGTGALPVDVSEKLMRAGGGTPYELCPYVDDFLAHDSQRH